MSFRRKKDQLEFSSEKIEDNSRKAWEFARRMIVDGITPLETISRLTGLNRASVQELAARNVRNSDKDA
jgi:hypothetical protein